MSYIVLSDSGFGLQLKNFNDKLPNYAGALGVTPAELASVDADTSYYLDVILAQQNFQKLAESITRYKDLLRYGNGNRSIRPFSNLACRAHLYFGRC